MKSVRLSIVICTYNREKYIAESIESTLNQTAPRDTYQVIVVNNNSPDNTDAICRKMLNDGHQFDYFIEMNQGNSYARNRGITESLGDIVVFIDDDATMEPDYVKNLLSFYEQHPKVDAVGGKIIPRYENCQAPRWLSPMLMPIVIALDKGERIKKFRYKQTPIGANMSIRKHIFDEIGTFDVTLGRIGKGLSGGDETDLFNRMMARNKQIWYLPSAVVHHIIPAFRIETDYIRRIALGIGEGQRRRAIIQGFKAYFIACVKEIMKWGVFSCLALWYFITFRFSKALMLIRFRYWVSKGVFLFKSTLQ